MKKSYFFYIFCEAICLMLILIGFVIFVIWTQKWIISIIVCLAGIPFIQDIRCAILLLVDIKRGAKTEKSSLLGLMSSGNLEIFSKIQYKVVYFDNQRRHTPYKFFGEFDFDKFHSGSIVQITYFPRSRIVDKISKID